MALPPGSFKGIARSAASGRVFVRYQFDGKEASSLAADIAYATTPEAISSATRLHQNAKRVKDFLYKIHPYNPDGTKKSHTSNKVGPHLRDGWNVKVYEGAFQAGVVGARSLVGFFLSHKDENDKRKRVKLILSSLESGSVAYKVRPVNKKFLKFRVPYPLLDTIIRTSQTISIPAREGRWFLDETRKFADRLLATEHTLMEEEIVKIIEKGRRFKMRAADTRFTASNTADGSAIAAAREKFGVAFTQARSPLNKVRRVKSRRKTKPNA